MKKSLSGAVVGIVGGIQSRNNFLWRSGMSIREVGDKKLFDSGRVHPELGVFFLGRDLLKGALDGPMCFCPPVPSLGFPVSSVIVHGGLFSSALTRNSGRPMQVLLNGS